MERLRKSRRVREALLVRLVIALILVVISTQILLRSDGSRRFLNRSIRLEGEALSLSIQGLDQEAYPWLEWPPAGEAANTTSWVTLYFRFLGIPPEEAWVLVDGRPSKRIGADGGTITVRDGDNIGLYCPHGEVSVVISAVTRNLVSPQLGKCVTGQGTLSLGPVRLQ